MPLRLHLQANDDLTLVDQVEDRTVTFEAANPLWGVAPVTIGGEQKFAVMNAYRATNGAIPTPACYVENMGSTWSSGWAISFYCRWSVYRTSGFLNLMMDADGREIVTNNGTLSFRYYGSTLVTMPEPEYDGLWHSAKFTSDGITISMYFDNVLVDSVASTRSIRANLIRVGYSGSVSATTVLEWAEFKMWDEHNDDLMPLIEPYNRTYGSGCEVYQELDDVDLSLWTYNHPERRWECYYPNSGGPLGGVCWGAIMFRLGPGVVKRLHIKYEITLETNFDTDNCFADLIALGHADNVRNQRHFLNSSWIIFGAETDWDEPSNTGTPLRFRVDGADYPIVGADLWDQPHGVPHLIEYIIDEFGSTLVIDNETTTLGPAVDTSLIQQFSCCLDAGIHPNNMSVYIKVLEFNQDFGRTEHNVLRNRRLGIV